MRIVVVDDHDLLAEALVLGIAGRGHEVTRASNGREALGHLPAEDHTVFVIDWQLPDTRGDDIARTVRAQCPGAMIILTSGDSASQQIRDCCGPGRIADRFIGKPFTAGQLLDAIEETRGRKARPEERGTMRSNQSPLAAMQIANEDIRFRALVETAVDGVIVIDSGGRILMFNPACQRLFGYQSDEVVGRNVKMLMPAPFRDEHDGYLHNYRTSGVRKIIGIGREVMGQRRDGSVFPMDLSVGEWKEGDTGYFVGIIHDLTERKRTEAQLVQAQKMETVGQLSGGIAHDFNNLLTVIVGNAEVLGEKLRARPDLKQLCDGIFAAGARGAELTKHLLAFSRRQVLQPVVVDCNAMLVDLQRLLQRTVREDVEIRLQLSHLAVQAMADPAQLESAVINLSLNAQDAMPEGGILVFATSIAPLDQRYRDLNPEVPPGNYVLISVTDDGVGMTPDVLERVFEPFFTTKEVGKGSGLGLSMVYGFIKQSGGHVAIYSEPGLGTTVRMYLPMVQEPRTEEPEAEGPTSGHEDPDGHERVLVVEDDPFVRGYAVATLESLGYEVRTAASGREALGLLASAVAPFDLLFTDIVMPGGVNGWELAARAREVSPGLRVLFTSGYPMDTLLAQGRIAHGETLLMKPYRKSELAMRVRQVLGSPQGNVTN